MPCANDDREALEVDFGTKAAAESEKVPREREAASLES